MARNRRTIYQIIEPPPPPDWKPGEFFFPDQLNDVNRQSKVLEALKGVGAGLGEFVNSAVFKANEIPNWEQRGVTGEGYAQTVRQTMDSFNKLNSNNQTLQNYYAPQSQQVPQQPIYHSNNFNIMNRPNEEESYLSFIGETGNSAPQQQNPIEVNFSNALQTTETRLLTLCKILGETYKLNRTIGEKIDTLIALISQGAYARTTAAPMTQTAVAHTPMPQTEEVAGELTAEDVGEDIDLSSLESPRGDYEEDMEIAGEDDYEDFDEGSEDPEIIDEEPPAPRVTRPATRTVRRKK